MDITEKYFTRCQTVPGAKAMRDGKEIRYGDTLIVSIFQNMDDGSETQIGQYERSYGVLYRSWMPFVQNGKEYALFCPGTATLRAMELPSCKMIAKEESGGFCIVDLYVPYSPKDGIHGTFGFSAGCVWGDDNSWKIQFIDLSRISEGVIVHDNRFGYIAMVDLAGRKQEAFSLRESIDVGNIDLSDPDPENHSHKIFVKCEVEFDIRTGKML